jgi:hypothetical protein
MMKFVNVIFIVFLVAFQLSCSRKYDEKGFAVSPSAETREEEDKPDGISKDSLVLETRATNILLTSYPQYRLATIYKVNFHRDSTTYIGENYFHGSYGGYDEIEGNAFHYNLMPGLEAVYGYNLVNISHHNAMTQTHKNFFDKPVLVKTFYYPSFSKDTLNYKPVQRNYFMMSVYDEDTNKDGFINVRDLRRLYYFDIDANNRKPLVPVNYSIYKSEYDPANDYMYVFAMLDEDGNGKVSQLETAHVFWIDLKNPMLTGRQY